MRNLSGRKPFVSRMILAGLMALACISSASAAPVRSPKSLKKGFGLVAARDPKWQEKITGLNARWFYTWGGDKPDSVPRGVTFVPMNWGYYGNKDDNLVKWLAKVRAQPGVTALLGFNEPDGKDQANLSVDGALEGWPYMMQTGLSLGSPAAVHADNDWMKSFMRGAEEKHYRVDFICIHWYGGNDPQGFLAYLERIHTMYHRPVWVTEFAPADWSGKRGVTPQQAASFMRAVLPQMNKLAYVQRYAWYSAGTSDAALGAAGLFKDDGSLTELGKLYASF